jgi:hypothetical protein
MKFQPKSTLRLSLAMFLAVSGGQVKADWAQHTNPVIVAPAPKNMSTQVANPPVFTWARHPSNPASYVVEISSGGAVYKTFTVKRNWLFPSVRFPLGTYSWRVRPSDRIDWSDPRTIIIDNTAQDFIVPESDVLRNSIAVKPRPRAIQANIPIYANWSAALKAERGSAMARLRTEVEWWFTRLNYPSDSNWPLTSTSIQNAANVAQNAAVFSSIAGNGRQLAASALLYRLTGEQKYLTEAVARADALCNLNINGPTSYANQDQGTRIIALSLAQAFDLISGNVDLARRDRWLSVIDQRTTAIYNDLARDNGRMDQYPFDSHGGTNLSYLALIASLSVGNIRNANNWFDFSFRAAVASTSVWSGPEGGFANGTAYAEYTAQILQSIWQPIGAITGVNMFDKPWSQGYMNFMMYFLPPGSTRHVFGDGHESKPVLGIPKAFASRYPTPNAAWYYRAVSDETDALTTLEAPYPMPVMSATPAPPPNSAIFPSIGWAAIHSNISDANRTSVFFKSSPYGSYNHSHADQNSFVVTKGGKPLLVEAGYSDYYGSPLADSWYRQTKAHNAITYDGGNGQATGGYTSEGYTRQMKFTGRLTAFSDTSAVVFVEGDATPTYDGALTQATRKLWYLRDVDAIVVLDTLAADTARRFEWNLHSLAPMAFEGSTRTVNVTDASGTARVCVRPILSAPDFTFERRSAPAPQMGTIEDHAVYISSAARKTQEFLMLVDVGCKRPALGITISATARTLTVGKQAITLPR